MPDNINAQKTGFLMNCTINEFLSRCFSKVTTTTLADIAPFRFPPGSQKVLMAATEAHFASILHYLYYAHHLMLITIGNLPTTSHLLLLSSISHPSHSTHLPGLLCW
jgi:hypothetical protein